MEVSLESLLAARDARVQNQLLLLTAWPQATLLCLTVVFPGPVKRDVRSVRVGNEGVEAVREALPVLYEEIRDLETGFEAFFVVDLPAEQAKRRACRIEDGHPHGRLMDLDVIRMDPAAKAPVPLSRSAVGLPERRCLVCSQPARICMRARTHTKEQLQAAIDRILK